MIDPFYLASIPSPPKVLGLQLRPLALGHLILLNFVESAFITGGLPDWNDLALSTLFCASTYEEGCDYIHNPDTAKSMRVWADKLTGMNRISVRLGFCKPTPIDFEAESEKFYSYVNESTAIRKYQFKVDDFHALKCPMVQVVKVTLMRDMRFSEAELLNRSWALCLDDYVTLKAVKGEVKLQDEQDIAEIQSALDAAKELAENIKEGRFICPS